MSSAKSSLASASRERPDAILARMQREAEDLIRKLSWSSRLNGDWSFLTYLYDLGYSRADKWLAQSFDCIGVKSTVNLREKYF